MEAWIPDETLQKIALENNLSETAFFVQQAEDYHLRWFTSALEIDLCGHATLCLLALPLEEETQQNGADSHTGIHPRRQSDCKLTQDERLEILSPAILYLEGTINI